MISYVKGNLVDADSNSIIVDNNGIGYNIFVPSSVLVDLPQVGEDIKIFTYLNVKEDAMNLYGFLTRDELNVFKLLITVNGIGPKGALAILSIMTADSLKMAIVTEDAKAISKAPGVGSKTAQRVIIDLKDKIKNEDIIGSQAPGTDAVVANNNANEAIMALTSLGYTNTEAKNAVKGIDVSLSVDEILKSALKNLL